MRLNLASGTDIRDGWRNLDIVPKWPQARRGCDVIWDARKDRIPYDNNTATEIYAGYLLLHLAPCYHSSVLDDIYRVAAPNAPVVFGEVDMAKVMRHWLEDPNSKQASELIWGEQGDVHGTDLAEFDKHCHGFTEASLRYTLESKGFHTCERIQVHSDAVWYELTIRCQK